MGREGGIIVEGAPPPLGGRGASKEQSQAIVSQIIKFPPGEAHLVAKPRQHHNRPDTSKESGGGEAEEGGEGAAAEEE